MEADILIVGAGAAGLMAAVDLAEAGRSVIVVEARDRIGGRAHTITENFSMPVETGAEYIHGNLQLTLQLAKEAGLKTVPAEGEIWRSEGGRLFKQEDFIADSDALLQALHRQKNDISVATFLEQNFDSPKHEELKKSLRGYVEGYYAGEIERASVLALKEEWEEEEQPQHRIPKGYTALFQHLFDRATARGVQFRFSEPVQTVTWGFEKVTAVTTSSTITARKAVITLPVALLQSTHTKAGFSFAPEIPHYRSAFDQLGYGQVIKFLLEFNEPFWENRFGLTGLSFLFSEERIPTWWTQQPRHTNLLVGWCAGPNATKLKDKSDAELFQIAMQSLAAIFNQPVAELQQQLRASKIINWPADPFTAGGYSYITTTTKQALQTLSKPVEGTIYFAGEALFGGTITGTVEAALRSGRDTAHNLLASFSNT